ncbi:MAG: 1-acyl-sn-glycerol-3-phosphate acyltransferase, partial [Planctomycetota bacterium]|nr:1-acyl-sn-glycerol-3-phosphate acyltransferase [Planctomycetota bacterium]
MTRVLLILANLVLWPLTFLFFVIAVPLVVLLLVIFGPVRVDFAVRWMCRMIVRLGGARVVTEFAEPLDTNRTRIYISNHVNLFDPFVLGGVTPRLRGLELESHFKIPIYGALMRWVGNVPVSDERTPAALKRTYRLMREARDLGLNVCVFPEGTRTRDGSVGPFATGGFRMARQLGVPLT